MTVVIDRTRTLPPEARRDGSVSAAARARSKGDPGGGLYKPRAPIYPKLVHGRWRQIKWALMILTLIIYYVTPWIRWDRPGKLPDQAILVDFAGRRFYFFDIQLWPQEVYFITGLLVLAALALFLVSALFGRLWCGYACPQTVWTDLFLFVERQFEGDRNARMKRDSSPMTFDTLWRKTAKHMVWLGIAFGTGGAWIFYFHDAPSLLSSFWIGQAPATAYIFCALLTFTTYVFAGFMREQICIYMCPWPRIQGAMLDKHSLQVTYLRDRGETRGPHKKNETWEGRGDCIDCNQCVVACPMGIDIRDGGQLECINCGLCIDACDEIMDRVGRPRGLIAYDTDSAVDKRACGEKPTYHLVRPRTIFYASVLALVSGIMLWGLTHRVTLDLHVLRDRNPTFVRLHDGAIRNGYTLKVANRGFADRDVEIDFAGLQGVSLKTPGAPAVPSPIHIRVPANEIRALRLFVTVPADKIPEHANPARFVVRSLGESVESKTTFLAGAANGD